MVRESIITLALWHKFVYEFIGNNTCIIQDRIALSSIHYFRSTNPTFHADIPVQFRSGVDFLTGQQHSNPIKFIYSEKATKFD